MKKSGGFTIIELIVVIGIFMTLLSLAWINLTSLPSRTASTVSALTVISDIRAQQIQAMTGDTAGAERSGYGVYFTDTSYTLFKGDMYVPGDPKNFRVDLTDANLAFSDITFPAGAIVFGKGSGDVVGYSPGSDSVSLANHLTSETKILRFSRYGATY